MLSVLQMDRNLLNTRALQPWKALAWGCFFVFFPVSGTSWFPHCGGQARPLPPHSRQLSSLLMSQELFTSAGCQVQNAWREPLVFHRTRVITWSRSVHLLCDGVVHVCRWTQKNLAKVSPMLVFVDFLRMGCNSVASFAMSSELVVDVCLCITDWTGQISQSCFAVY